MDTSTHSRAARYLECLAFVGVNHDNVTVSLRFTRVAVEYRPSRVEFDERRQQQQQRSDDDQRGDRNRCLQNHLDGWIDAAR